MNYSPEASLMRVAFNSLSAASTNPRDVLNPRSGTQRLGERIASLHSTLGETFGDDAVSVSFLPGRNVDLPMLGTLLREKDIPIHSVDIPDVKRLPTAVAKAAGNVLIGDRTQAERYVGWAMSNVGSRRQQRQRTREGLEIADSHDTRRVVKANAEFWREQRQGQELVDELKRRGEEIVMAVEIDASVQTQSDYFTFMDRLRKATLGSHIKVHFDLDTGHLERSTSYHDNSGNKPANAVLADVFADPKLAAAVEIVSLNQYVIGEPHSHAHLNHGDIDLVESAKLIGDGMRSGKLHSRVTILFETQPNDYEWFSDKSTNGGVVFSQKLKKGFDNAA